MSANNVYKKLQAVRHEFVMANVKKTGKNKFAGYEYFELGDFIPVLHRMFDAVGLIGVVGFNTTEAKLTVYNSEVPEESIVFTSPMVFASNPKGQAIQDLGSTHTYMRRYLWLLAMEITEHDSVDSSAPSNKPEPKAEVKAEPKAEPKAEVKTEKPEDQAMFVTKMIEHALIAEDRAGLTDLWKSNQKQIDILKSGNTEQYKKLQQAFAEIKTNLGEA